nr:restriction endonuclease subunit S [Propionicimonas sp.]
MLRQLWRPVSVADIEVVPFAGVRWYAEGVYHRDDQPAVAVKTKMLNRIEKGDVVYNRMWATKASFGVVGDDAHGCLVTNDFPIFEATEAILAGFVALLFQWKPFQAAAAGAATGTTERRRLNEKEFVRLRMPIPPIPEQRRIVDLVGALDDAASRLDTFLTAANNTHDAMRRHLMAGGSGWRLAVLGDVAAPTTGRAFPARFQGRQTGEFPYIKCSDMNIEGQHRIIETAANWIDEAGRGQLGARILPAGTVIFPILGAALATEKRRLLGRPAAFDQNVMGLEPGPDLTPDFLLALMSEIRLSSLAQRGAVPSVNQSIVASIQVSVPTLDEQDRIGSLLSEAAETVTKAMASAAKLCTLRTQLLTALLSGEHAIPESYDELIGGPAHVGNG